MLITKIIHKIIDNTKIIQRLKAFSSYRSNEKP